MQEEEDTASPNALKKRLLKLLYELSFKYSEEPIFNLAYKKEKSNYYIDAKKTTLSPEGMVLLGHIIYNMIADLEVDGIGGLTFGADPMAIGAAVIANSKGKRIKAFSVRQELKDHGTKQWIEGIVEPDDKVVIVDDVVTTGTSTLHAVEIAREAGLNVIKVIVLVDRQEGGRERIEEKGIDVEALFTKDDLIGLYNERRNKEIDSRRSVSR